MTQGARWSGGGGGEGGWFNRCDYHFTDSLNMESRSAGQDTGKLLRIRNFILLNSRNSGVQNTVTRDYIPFFLNKKRIFERILVEVKFIFQI